MEKKDIQETALFAPDYDVEVDPLLVDAAVRRLAPAFVRIIQDADDHGILPTSTKRVLARDLILHGLAEIFELQLTPLGLAVRERIKMKGKRT